MYKKIIAVLLSCFILSGIFYTAAAESTRLGDGDGDGVITVSDVVYLRRIIMIGESASDAMLKVLDVDADNTITVSDVVKLRDMIMKGEKPVFSEGWNNFAGNRYYSKDGKLLTGGQVINGLRYEFDNTGVCLTYAGIDVSTWQSAPINWNSVAGQGVEFAIVRLGYRGYGSAGTMKMDDKYHAHMSGAKAAGINTGVYFFSQAIGAAEGAGEAAFVLANLGNYQVTYPIVIDVEYVRPSGDTARADDISKRDRTDAVKAFCDTILAAGYYPAIYANPDMCSNGLYMNELTGYDLWLAHYTDSTSFSYPFKIWQYSSKGTVNGISGLVDINMSYRNYPKFLKANGYNKLS